MRRLLSGPGPSIVMSAIFPRYARLEDSDGFTTGFCHARSPESEPAPAVTALTVAFSTIIATIRFGVTMQVTRPAPNLDQR